MNIHNLHNLEYFNCDNNQISTLDLTNLENMLSVTCANNNITSFVLTGANNITNVICNNNLLSKLDLTSQKNLTKINCAYNTISTFTLPDSLQLTSIICNNNKLSSINLLQYKAVQILQLDNNKLTNLDITDLANLSILNVNNNNIKSLPSLKSIGNIKTYNFTYNDMEIDETNRLLALGFEKQFVLPQNITIKSYDPLNPIIINIGDPYEVPQKIYVTLYNNTKVEKTVIWETLPHPTTTGTYNINGKIDGYFDVVQQLVVKEVSLTDIKTLKALRDANPNSTIFTKWADSKPYNQWEGVIWTDSAKPQFVKELNIVNTLLTGSCSLTNLKYLQKLSISDNALTSLDITGNIILNTLYASNNKLATFTYDACPELHTIILSNNPLNRIALTNANFVNVSCTSCNLSEITTSNLHKLKILELDDNKISVIDLRDNESLETLSIKKNKLSDINFASCPNISYINVYENKLNNLHSITTKGIITLLDCRNNFMSSTETDRLIALGFEENRIIPQHELIVSYEPFRKVYTKVNIPVTLPLNALVTYYDGKKEQLPVVWEQYFIDKVGTFTIKGLVADYYQVEIILIVTSEGDLEMLKALRDSNPTSKLPGMWSDDKDPYTQWTGVTWNAAKTSVTKLDVNDCNIKFLMNE